MKGKQVFKRYFVVFCALFLLVAAVISGRSVLPAFAAVSGYTGALEDLRKDSAFDANEYPDNKDDYDKSEFAETANFYSVRVIQIAESTDRELLLYTYQPCQKTRYLVATEINMSLSESADGTKLYGLTLISCDGVFGKYKVNGFTVSKDETRYYNVKSIYREWIEGVDAETGNDNVKNAVAFKVGKCFKAETVDGKVNYSCKDTDVIEIINPVAGFLQYSNGFKLCPDWCDSHYVAFSTNKKIDYLLEADVSYTYRKATQSSAAGASDSYPKYEESVEETVSLKGKDKGGNEADGFLAKKYEWERIESINQFLNDSQNKFTDEAKEKLTGAQWVLRFCETPRGVTAGVIRHWTEVSDVTVLRLKFVTDGRVYNLGAVSDKVTEGNSPDNTNTAELAGFFEWLARKTGVGEWVWKLIFALVVLAIFMPLISVLIPPVGKALLWVLKGIWWVVSLPFRAIASLFSKDKDN